MSINRAIAPSLAIHFRWVSQLFAALNCVFHTTVTGYFTEFAGHDQFIFAVNFELDVTGKVV